jgi:hypothetical protein
MGFIDGLGEWNNVDGAGLMVSFGNECWTHVDADTNLLDTRI